MKNPILKNYLDNITYELYINTVQLSGGENGYTYNIFKSTR